MLSNDIKKGMRVLKKNGWYGTVMDNRKGNLRCINTEGYVTEAGDDYVWNISQVETSPGVWEKIELTEAQKKARSTVRGMFG